MPEHIFLLKVIDTALVLQYLVDISGSLYLLKDYEMDFFLNLYVQYIFTFCLKAISIWWLFHFV